MSPIQTPSLVVAAGTATQLQTSPISRLKGYASAYGRLHDMISDMVEGGRLTEALIPDDHQALVRQLEICGTKDHTVSADIAKAERGIELLAESLAKWEDEEESVKEEKADHIEELSAYFDAEPTTASGINVVDEENRYHVEFCYSTFAATPQEAVSLALAAVSDHSASVEVYDDEQSRCLWSGDIGSVLADGGKQ